MSRWLLPALLVLILASCEPYYEREFYERISGMHFPPTARAIESMDNGEFITITAFKVDSLDLRRFMERYGFKPVENDLYLRRWSESCYLKRNTPGSLVNLYYKAGEKGKNSWYYVADLQQQKLWAEVQYPDWGGH